MDERRTIWLGACDVSADQNAARLANAIRQQAPDVRLLGAGGVAMRKAGVEVGVWTTHLSFTGVLGAGRILRELVSLFRQVQRQVSAVRPDLVVLVDGEIASFPLAAWLRRKGIPVLFYFPPQVWLWGRWRLPLTVPLIRRVLSAFPDEAELYRRAGADTVWTGHPLRDSVRVGEDPIAALRAAGLDPGRPLVGLMPGSRRNEIETLCPPFLAAARLLQRRRPELQFALPLASETLRKEIERHVRQSGLHDVVLYHPSSYAILSRAGVVLQCSGTATLETALLGVPSVIAYRCIPLEYFFARLIMRVRFIGMPNILLGEAVQPEFFHRNVDAEHLADEAWSLLTDRVRRERIRSQLATLPDLLGPPGALRRAAAAVVDLLPAAEQAASMPEHQAVAVGGGREGI
jgi:lipid-A-disaccharide synthase